MEFPGETKVKARVLGRWKRDTGESEWSSRQGAVAAGCAGGGRGPRPRSAGRPQELEKARAQSLPRGLRTEHSPADTLVLGPLSPS